MFSCVVNIVEMMKINLQFIDNVISIPVLTHKTDPSATNDSEISKLTE